MRIEQNQPTAAALHVQKGAKPSAPQPEPAVSAFEDSHRLNQALTSTPEVRSEQVARAKALLADPNYPSPKQLENVAGLLAQHLSREN